MQSLPPRVLITRILVLFLMLSSFNLLAQQGTPPDECNTIVSEEQMTQAIADVPLIQAYEAARSESVDTTFVPVFFYVNRYADGRDSYPTPFEDYAQKMLDTLNVHFSVPALYFVQCGNIQYVDNDFVMDSLVKFVSFSYISSALNIYIKKNGSGSEAVYPADIDLGGAAESYNNVIRIKLGSAESYETVVHEVGHSYGLFHTFEQVNIYNNPKDPLLNYPFPVFLDHPYDEDENSNLTNAISHRELVRRVDAPISEQGVNFPNRNFTFAGDLLGDTHASCQASREFFPSAANPSICWEYPLNTSFVCKNGCKYDVINCDYTGDYLDYNGDSLNDNIVHNFMSYFNGCRTEFTAGQYGRISYYNYINRKPQYDFSLQPNLSDRVEFEDSDKPLQDVEIHFTHDNDDRFTNVLTGKSGYFQGMLYEAGVSVSLNKWGSNHVEETVFEQPDFYTVHHFLPTPEDWREGISTHDLLLIRKHILGIQALNGYRQLAADANASGTITTFDLINLQKLLLGISDDLPGLTYPWRFLPEYIPANDSTAFNSDPFNMTIDGVPYTNEFPYLDNFDYTDTDGLDGISGFDGIKMGDVNGSSVEELCPPVDISLYLPIVSNGAGADIEIDIKPSSFQDIYGFQLALDIDKDYLEFLDVVPGSVNGLNKNDNFGLTKLNENELKVSWYSDDLSAQTLSFGQVLFTLKLRTKYPIANLSDYFDLNDLALKAEFYDANGCSKNLQLEGIVRTGGLMGLSSANEGNAAAVGVVKKEILTYQLNKLNCFPNPTKGDIQIVFKSDTEHSGDVIIQDALGHLVKTIPTLFHTGINEFRLLSEDLPEGLLLITINTPKGNFTQKVLKLK